LFDEYAKEEQNDSNVVHNPNDSSETTKDSVKNVEETEEVKNNEQ
jgi:hypothetical protein